MKDLESYEFFKGEKCKIRGVNIGEKECLNCIKLIKTYQNKIICKMYQGEK